MNKFVGIAVLTVSLLVGQSAAAQSPAKLIRIVSRQASLTMTTGEWLLSTRSGGLGQAETDRSRVRSRLKIS